MNSYLKIIISDNTVQKMKFSIKNFFSRCDQNRSFLRMWSHLLNKSLMENFVFCAVQCDHTIKFVYSIWFWPSFIKLHYKASYIPIPFCHLNFKCYLCINLLKLIKLTNILGQDDKVCGITSVISFINWSIIPCDIVLLQHQ